MHCPPPRGGLQAGAELQDRRHDAHRCGEVACILYLHAYGHVIRHWISTPVSQGRLKTDLPLLSHAELRAGQAQA